LGTPKDILHVDIVRR